MLFAKKRRGPVCRTSPQEHEPKHAAESQVGERPKHEPSSGSAERAHDAMPDAPIQIRTQLTHRRRSTPVAAWA